MQRIQLNPLKQYQNSKALVKIVWEELERLRLETWTEKIKIDDESGGVALMVPLHLHDFCNEFDKSNGMSLNKARATLSGENLLLLLSSNYAYFCESLAESSDEITWSFRQ